MMNDDEDDDDDHYTVHAFLLDETTDVPIVITVNIIPGWLTKNSLMASSEVASSDDVSADRRWTWAPFSRANWRMSGWSDDTQMEVKPAGQNIQISESARWIDPLATPYITTRGRRSSFDSQGTSEEKVSKFFWDLHTYWRLCVQCAGWEERKKKNCAGVPILLVTHKTYYYHHHPIIYIYLLLKGRRKEKVRSYIIIIQERQGVVLEPSTLRCLFSPSPRRRRKTLLYSSLTTTNSLSWRRIRIVSFWMTAFGIPFRHAQMSIQLDVYLASLVHTHTHDEKTFLLKYPMKKCQSKFNWSAARRRKKHLSHSCTYVGREGECYPQHWKRKLWGCGHTN